MIICLVPSESCEVMVNIEMFLEIVSTAMKRGMFFFISIKGKRMPKRIPRALFCEREKNFPLSGCEEERSPFLFSLLFSIIEKRRFFLVRN